MSDGPEKGESKPSEMTQDQVLASIDSVDKEIARVEREMQEVRGEAMAACTCSNRARI